jgi:uncharacterized protein (TIGR02117 family)
LKKLFKFIGYTLLSFIAFVALYILAAYTLSRIAVAKEADSASEVAMYIKTNGVHTDLVVPVHSEQIDWSKEIRYANTIANDTSMQYLAMGWGDKGFYLETPTWADLTFRVAFKAAFALGHTAIHATFYKSLHEGDSCKKIMISKAQYARLINYISNSFRKDSAGHAIKIITNANYGKTDAFYEANGSYSLFHTCNTWANNGLKASGQRACLWTPFDTGIFLKYK